MIEKKASTDILFICDLACLLLRDAFSISAKLYLFFLCVIFMHYINYKYFKEKEQLDFETKILEFCKYSIQKAHQSI
jgi:hypothetical protein